MTAPTNREEDHSAAAVKEALPRTKDRRETMFELGRGKRGTAIRKRYRDAQKRVNRRRLHFTRSSRCRPDRAFIANSSGRASNPSRSSIPSSPAAGRLMTRSTAKAILRDLNFLRNVGISLADPSSRWSCEQLENPRDRTTLCRTVLQQ